MAHNCHYLHPQSYCRCGNTKTCAYSNPWETNCCPQGHFNNCCNFSPCHSHNVLGRYTICSPTPNIFHQYCQNYCVNCGRTHYTQWQTVTGILPENQKYIPFLTGGHKAPQTCADLSPGEFSPCVTSGMGHGCRHGGYKPTDDEEDQLGIHLLKPRAITDLDDVYTRKNFALQTVRDTGVGDCPATLDTNALCHQVTCPLCRDSEDFTCEPGNFRCPYDIEADVAPGCPMYYTECRCTEQGCNTSKHCIVVEYNENECPMISAECECCDTGCGTSKTCFVVEEDDEYYDQYGEEFQFMPEDGYYCEEDEYIESRLEDCYPTDAHCYMRECPISVPSQALARECYPQNEQQRTNFQDFEEQKINHNSVMVQSGFVTQVQPSVANSPSHQKLFSNDIHQGTSTTDMDKNNISETSCVDPSFKNLVLNSKPQQQQSNSASKHPQIVIDLSDGGSSTKINIKSNFCPGSENAKSRHHEPKPAVNHTATQSTTSLGMSSTGLKSVENFGTAAEEPEYVYDEANHHVYRTKRRVCRDPEDQLMPNMENVGAPRMSMAGGRMSMMPRMSMALGGGRMSTWKGGRMSMAPGAISGWEMVQDYPDFLDCGAEDCVDVLDKRALRSGNRAVKLQNWTHASAADRLADKADTLAFLRSGAGVKVGPKRVTIAPGLLEAADLTGMSTAISPPGRVSVAPNGTLMSIQPSGVASAANLRMSMAPSMGRMSMMPGRMSMMPGRMSMMPGRMSMAPQMGPYAPMGQYQDPNVEKEKFAKRGFNMDYFTNTGEAGIRRFCTNDPLMMSELEADLSMMPLPPSVEAKMSIAQNRMSMAALRQSVAPAQMLPRASMVPTQILPRASMVSRGSMMPAQIVQRASVAPFSNLRFSVAPPGDVEKTQKIGGRQSMVQIKGQSHPKIVEPSSVRIFPDVNQQKQNYPGRVKSQVRFT